MNNQESIYNDKKADPFKLIDAEGLFVEDNEIEFSQPPATKWELWSYYLYYNGVRSIDFVYIELESLLFYPV
jgi:hypothetical protein